MGLVTGVGLGLLLGTGCAQTHPCLIIPMQLKLAQSTVDDYQKQITEKQADVDRMKSGMDMARTRLQQLKDEESELLRLISAAKADSARKEGK
jgi:hypothetical protein